MFGAPLSIDGINEAKLNSEKLFPSASHSAMMLVGCTGEGNDSTRKSIVLVTKQFVRLFSTRTWIVCAFEVFEYWYSNGFAPVNASAAEKWKDTNNPV